MQIKLLCKSNSNINKLKLNFLIRFFIYWEDSMFQQAFYGKFAVRNLESGDANIMFLTLFYII